MDSDFLFFLMMLLVVVLPLGLGIIQPILSVVFAFRRKKKGQSVSRLIIYWLLAASFLIYYFIAPPYWGMSGLPQYFILCYIPAIWFFFAGIVSDKWNNKKSTK